MKIVYSPRFDIRFGGLEKLHPFDSCKYSRAWNLVPELHSRRISVPIPASRAMLERVHEARYLRRLWNRNVLAQTLELAPVAFLPSPLTHAAVLLPMRYGVAATAIGARAALGEGLVFSLSGGYHHAKPGSGEGFCVFNDIAVAVKTLRAEGVLAENATVAYIDLDAHLGNGVAHCFLEDPTVKLFDMYNGAIYPQHDDVAKKRIDSRHPLKMHTPGSAYLTILAAELPPFLDALDNVGLAIYNAGTDVFEDDSLGGLRLTEADVLQRDLFVLDALRSRNLPTLVLPSGGYSDASHRLIAATLREAGRLYGGST